MSRTILVTGTVGSKTVKAPAPARLRDGMLELQRMYKAGYAAGVSPAVEQLAPPPPRRAICAKPRAAVSASGVAGWRKPGVALVSLKTKKPKAPAACCRGL